MRNFKTGATRDSDTTKPDYEGFLSPLVVEEFGKYMTTHRVQADGAVRDSDNWQKGIPRTVYIKSKMRHDLDLWKLHRGHKVIDPKTKKETTIPEACCAIMFNTMGYLFEYLCGRK